MSTIPELLLNADPESVYMVSHDDIEWKMKDVCEHSMNVAKALTYLDANTITIFASNSPRHTTSMLGSMIMGGRMCSLYCRSTLRTCEYVLKDSRSSVIFVDNEERLLIALAAKKRIRHLKTIVMIGDCTEYYGPDVYTWEDFLKFGERGEVRVHTPTPDDCCAILYTSGTTGNPKGVLISHDNLIFAANGHIQNNPCLLSEPMRFISHLPTSHIGSIMNEIIVPLMISSVYKQKSKVYYTDKPVVDIETLKRVRPTMIFCVPRIWERIADAAQEIEKGLDGILHRRMKTLCSISHTHRQHGGYRVLANVDMFARFYMRRSVLRQIGLDSMKLPLTGGAYTEIETLKYFGSLGFDLLGAYGMSEIMGVQTISRPNFFLDDYSGIPICGTEVKVDDKTGELYFRGRQVAMGYNGITKPFVDKDGWFATGDVGEIHESGHIRVTGRMDDLIITSTGKKIVPEPIESKLCKECDDIDGAVLVGHRRKYMGLLLLLKPNCDISRAIECVKHYNDNYAGSSSEKIRRIVIIKNKFTIEDGDLTPSNKIRRANILKKYKNEIDTMYFDVR